MTKDQRIQRLEQRVESLELGLTMLRAAVGELQRLSLGAWYAGSSANPDKCPSCGRADPHVCVVYS